VLLPDDARGLIEVLGPVLVQRPRPKADIPLLALLRPTAPNLKGPMLRVKLTCAGSRIEIDNRTRIYLIYRDRESNLNKGKFIFGSRRAAAWTGYASSDSGLRPRINSEGAIGLSCVGAVPPPSEDRLLLMVQHYGFGFPHWPSSLCDRRAKPRGQLPRLDHANFRPQV
jgi:hypothetical protein